MALTNVNLISDLQWKSAPLLNVDGLSQDIGRTLVVAPHPDDEALGCGGIIALLRSQGAEVHVLFVTNGGASHPNSKQFPTEKLQSLRKTEAIKSCEILGVKEDDIHFSNLKDSKLHTTTNEQKESFNNQLSQIFNRCSFDSILTTWRRDAHSDHRETYKLCKNFIEQYNIKIQMIEYPIWLWKNGNAEDWPQWDEVEPFRLNIESVLETKQTAIQQHVSQTTRLIDDDPEGFILTENLLEPFTTKFEYFLFTLPEKKDTLERSYFSRLYDNSDDPWEFKTSHYERQKYLKTLEYLKYYRFDNALEIGCSIGEHSNLLSRHCEQLTAIDISPDAIASAKEKFAQKKINFEVWNASEGLPKGVYNLITLCEVGYYLNKEDLVQLFNQIHQQLAHNGILLLVHWTSYVRDYPLTGRKVHNIFENLDFVNLEYQRIAEYKHTHYELILWQKT